MGGLGIGLTPVLGELDISQASSKLSKPPTSSAYRKRRVKFMLTVTNASTSYGRAAA